MKVLFQIPEGQDEISVSRTRDSVCAGDDYDAQHEEIFKMQTCKDPSLLVNGLASGYLPKVAGLGHRWGCRFNGVRIAMMKGDQIEILVREIVLETVNEVHFTYHSAPD